MASVTVRTKPITREKLAKYFPDNHELVRFLENVAQDVVINIPAAVNPTLVGLDDVQQTAELASAVAIAARGMAIQALILGSQANEGPPAAPQALTPDDAPPAAPILLAADPDDAGAQIASLRERVAVLERVVANYKEGPTP